MIRSVESKLFSAYINKTETPLLDLGCGNGTFGKSLELEEVYGIDIDEKAIESISNNGYYNNVRLASASEIPFPDSFFGTVFSNCALEHMDDLDRIINEVRRVLKKSGKFVFTVPTAKFFQVIKEDRVLDEVGLNNDKVLDEYNRFHHHVNILEIDKWKEIIENSGLRISSYRYYLPGAIGRFIARMDMLYTVETPESKKLIRKLHKRYRSIMGLPMRLYFSYYLITLHKGLPGTHLIVSVEKK